MYTFFSTVLGGIIGAFTGIALFMYERQKTAEVVYVIAMQQFRREGVAAAKSHKAYQWHRRTLGEVEDAIVRLRLVSWKWRRKQIDDIWTSYRRIDYETFRSEYEGATNQMAYQCDSTPCPKQPSSVLYEHFTRFIEIVNETKKDA
jgi:hypothetical protein